MIFDTHAHYDDEAFDEDREQVLASLAAANVGRLVNVGASIDSSRRSIRLAEAYDNIYCAVGIHPDSAAEFDTLSEKLLYELAENDRCVAIGEIGLDYYWDNCERSLQAEVFNKQLLIARELDKPVIIHSREACRDTFEIMSAYSETVDTKKHVPGVIHCFSYAAENAEAYVRQGYMIGVGGVVTFKNARKLVETVDRISLSDIVIETDCPYLAPVPFRGKRNDSRNLIYVINKIAEIKNVTPEEVMKVTCENAFRLYRL
ncbi:MAG: TatD family hydrolase [Clostridiales bacterium]|nr:TatD family hydrolase [Clostridiales bacterium]